MIEGAVYGSRYGASEGMGSMGTLDMVLWFDPVHAVHCGISGRGPRLAVEARGLRKNNAFGFLPRLLTSALADHWPAVAVVAWVP